MTGPLSPIWAMDPAMYEQWRHRHAEAVSVGQQFTAEAVEAAARSARGDDSLPLQVRDGVGVVPVQGPIMRAGGGLLAALLGIVGTDDMRRAVQAAAQRDDVREIVLRINSPGGSVEGLAELSDAVLNARQSKRVTAQVDGMAASAAYHVASQATRITAGRMDMVGSIGVRLMVADTSRMAANEGVKMIPVDTGEFKSAGAPGTEVTERQQADFQRIVDQHFADFVGAVARGRGMTEPQVRELADGRMFIASTEAMPNGLVDAIQTFDETFAELREPAGSGAERRRQRAGALRAKFSVATTEIH